MFDIVLGYALINIVFELFVLALFVPPKPKLWLLGSSRGIKTVHIVMFCFTLWVHWGGLLGTQAAFAAFPASVLGMFIAKQFFGFARMEPRTVSTNDTEFVEALSMEQKEEMIRCLDNNTYAEFKVMVPIYHRRVLGYNRAEVI